MNINLTTEVITLGVTLLGTILTGAFVAGGLFNRINQQEKSTGEVKDDMKDIKKDIKSDMKDLSSKIDTLSGQMALIVRSDVANNLSVSNSPRKLSSLGEKVLIDSGIKDVLDIKIDQIIELTRQKKPENSYQAQEAIIDVVQSLATDDDIKDAVEEGAFQSGHTPFEVLFVGALDIRDKVMKELGFIVEDIDKHDPTKNNNS